VKEIFLLVLILIGAVAFDISTDKIPNWYIGLSSAALLVQRFFLTGGSDIIGTFLSVIFPILILFPLFIFGLLGAADIKLFAMLGICFSLKEGFVIFTLSLIAGLLIGIIKAIINRSFGERFGFLYRFTQNLIRKICAKDTQILEESYMDSLDKKELKKGSIHFSLPILIAVIIRITGG